MSSLIKKVPSSNGYDLFNGDFEEGTKHYRTYKDSQVASPEDGIGGTPQYISITASNINPLLGNNSGIISKSLGNGQGEGVSIDFELSDGVLNNNALLSFIYTTSNDYVTGDIKLFLYDITNSLVYNISDTDLSSSVNVSKHEANIWFNATSKKYRLIFHIASTNTNAYTVKLDDIKINNEVKILGSIIGEWTSYIPTFTGWGTVTSQTFWWRRVGSNVQIRGRFLTGAPTGVEAQITLPSGLVSSSEINTLMLCGDMARSAASSSLVSYKVLIEPTKNYLVFSASSATSFALTKSFGTGITSGNENFSLYCELPISGWGSNTNLITDFQEFASNSSTADANDLTSFVNGPEGSSALFTFTGARIRRVRFKKPIQPTDKIIVELYNSPTGQWLDASNAFLRINGVDIISNGAGTSGIGIIGNSSSIPNTDFDVMFFTYRSGTSHWSVGTGLLKWRVRKISNGNSAESIPSGIYESGSNDNGSWIKYIDGTMECWHRVSTNISTDYLFFNWTYPVPFTSEPIVSTKLSAGGSAVWALHSSGIGTASSVTNITYYKSQQGTYANPNYLDVRAIGKWNNALQVYAPGALVGITIEESGSNSNGSYIKYSDGTMLCYGVITASINGGFSVTLPASFKDTSFVAIGSGSTKSNYGTGVTISMPISTTNSFGGYVFGFTGSGSNPHGWFAIGRWK